MRKSFSKIALAAITGIALAFTISCDTAGNPSALVGRWIGVSGEDKDGVLELLSDGTGIASKNSKGQAITWKTEKGRFYITTASGFAESESYKVQGSLLTFAVFGFSE